MGRGGEALDKVFTRVFPKRGVGGWKLGVPLYLLARLFCPLKGNFGGLCFGFVFWGGWGWTAPLRALWAPGDICQRHALGRLPGGRRGWAGGSLARGGGEDTDYSVERVTLWV